METQTETIGDQFKLIQKKEYPDPRSLSTPPATYEPKPQVALADLTPKSYQNVVGRVVYYKTTERQDELGTKVIFTGIIEDASFRVPFVCQKLKIPITNNRIHRLAAS